MARVHPAVPSLLLSLPILRLSICFWAETHGTSCSAQRTSQKFTSCSSALLLHTSPIPRTCINSLSCTQIARWHTNRQANASPFYRYSSPPTVVHINAIKHISNSACPTEMKSIILFFLLAQIWSDSGNILCYFSGAGKEKESTRFDLNQWMRESETSKIPTTHTSLALHFYHICTFFYGQSSYYQCFS